MKAGCLPFIEERTMSQKEEQLMRLALLEENGVITETAADFARSVVDRLADCGYASDALETFVTHLAMAGQRALDGVDEEPYDRQLIETLTEEEGYDEALALRNEILKNCLIPFSDTEREFLLVHAINLVS